MLAMRVAPLVLGASLLLTSLFAWPRFTKPFWVALLLVAASSQYFMVSYGTVMDKGMIHNILQTDARESSDLFNIKLLAEVLIIAVLPAIWLWKTRSNAPAAPGATCCAPPCCCWAASP